MFLLNHFTPFEEDWHYKWCSVGPFGEFLPVDGKEEDMLKIRTFAVRLNELFALYYGEETYEYRKDYKLLNDG